MGYYAAIRTSESFAFDLFGSFLKTRKVTHNENENHGYNTV
ncbi:hypothetical protein vB_SenM-2_189 [Salmonella phage vB_SenM-2]|uniref:Uncharacterized protein n=2 Tax=Caudoviricetes TaxID=2731619 RepID=A0A1X9I978_9CAUD|nr:hypothetical protein vB_SenM-2_189 [Salmonella phage vB_SenM-2]